MRKEPPLLVPSDGGGASDDESGAGAGAPAVSSSLPLPPQNGPDASFDGPDSELSSGSSSSLDEVAPLPADVLANLRRTLLPGGTRSPWKLRCWASCGTVSASAGGYVSMQNIARALATEDPVDATAWNNLQTETLVVMILAGIFCTECTVILGKAVLQATAPPDGREGVVGSSFYLNRLLKSDVSPEVHQRIAARTRLSVLQSLIVVGLAFAMPLRTWLLSSRAAEGSRYEMDAATKYAYACVLVCFPPMVIIGTGWLLFLHVPMIIVGDHIRRIAAGVRALSAHSRPINFDALTRSVWHAHDLQQHLSALLAPLLKTFLLLAAVFSWHWALMATYPRDGKHPIRKRNRSPIGFPYVCPEPVCKQAGVCVHYRHAHAYLFRSSLRSLSSQIIIVVCFFSLLSVIFSIGIKQKRVLSSSRPQGSSRGCCTRDGS